MTEDPTAAGRDATRELGALFEGMHWELPPDIDLIVPGQARVLEIIGEASWPNDPSQDDDAHAIVFAFYELTSNAMTHGALGLPRDTSGDNAAWGRIARQTFAERGADLSVVVDISVNEERFTMTVADPGTGFNAEESMARRREEMRTAIAAGDLSKLTQGNGLVTIADTPGNSLSYNKDGTAATYTRQRSGVDI